MANAILEAVTKFEKDTDKLVMKIVMNTRPDPKGQIFHSLDVDIDIFADSKPKPQSKIVTPDNGIRPIR